MTRGRPPGDPGRPPGSARLAALRLLGRRDYSASEIAARLLARNYSPDDVKVAIASLTRDGTIDDARAAGAHVRTATAVKHRGSHRIRRELEARGFAPEAIRQAMASHGSADDLVALRRLLARHPSLEQAPADVRRRLFHRLLRRGFPADLIARALGRDADDL